MRKGYEGITDFIFMEDPLEKADIILIPGGSHKQLVLRAAELYKRGYANYILPSGGYNGKLINYQTEWEFLKEEAIKLGVPENAILKEDKATNTFENAAFSFEVCKANNIPLNKAILVCKNSHSRRAYITYKIHFPKETKIIVQPVIDGRGITKENWTSNEDHKNRVMGEVEKIGKYFIDHITKLK